VKFGAMIAYNHILLSYGQFCVKKYKDCEAMGISFITGLYQICCTKPDH